MSRLGFQIPRLLAAVAIMGSMPSISQGAETTAPMRGQVAEWPFVLPTPRQVRYGGLVEFPGWRWSARGLSARLAAEVAAVCGPSAPGGWPLELALKPGAIHREQEYHLNIGGKKAGIEAKGEAGLFYGLQSLRALQATVDGRRMVREAEIVDWPAFETRGLIAGTSWSKELGAMKFNLLQYPGGRGTLNKQLRRAYQGLVDDCHRQYARFLSHEGYKGCFWSEHEMLDFSGEGYCKLEDYYRVRWRMGAREFTVAFDDMEVPAGGGAELATKHAEACMVVYRSVRKLNPGCVIFFCPVPYAGTSDTKLFSAGLEDGIAYLDTIGRALPPDILVYWTGQGVFSPEVSSAQADNFGKMIGRKPFFWDNDCITWLNEMRPLNGRPADLFEHTSGYVGNVCDRQETPPAASLPVALTIADYLWNPGAYDSETGLKRAIRYVGGGQEEAVMEAWRAAQGAVAKGGTPVDATSLGVWREALKKAPNQDFARAFAAQLDQLAKPGDKKR
jgi:hypothetical protein